MELLFITVFLICFCYFARRDSKGIVLNKNHILYKKVSGRVKACNITLLQCLKLHFDIQTSLLQRQTWYDFQTHTVTCKRKTILNYLTGFLMENKLYLQNTLTFDILKLQQKSFNETCWKCVKKIHLCNSAIHNPSDKHFFQGVNKSSISINVFSAA